jgi:ADP-L-glycero-D-manno-heptose 6-epimerase
MIIVTGGAGFIGSNLVRGLNMDGHHDIIIVDDLSDASKLRNVNSLAISDYFDKEDFLNILPRLSDIDTIFHQGACTDTTESDRRYMMRNNYEYSKRLLSYALAKNIDFIYASSAAVYGNGDNGFREEPACEYPLNDYAISKLAFDNYVRRVVADAPIQIVGLRYFNVYGPQESHKGRMVSVAFQLRNQLKTGGSMKLFEGSREFRRDFIFVDDVIDVIKFFYKQPEKKGIFNCGTGVARSFYDIATTLKELEGRGEIIVIPFPKDLVGKYQAFTEASLAKLRAAGYEAEFTSLKEGIKRYNEMLSTTERYRG